MADVVFAGGLLAVGNIGELPIFLCLATLLITCLKLSCESCNDD